MFHCNNTLDEIALVPGADMLNVVKASNLNTAWSSSSADFFTVSSDAEPIGSGQELYESYCRHCDNIAMMKSWGVYLEDNPNAIHDDRVNCTSSAGITMRRAAEAALQLGGGNAMAPGWRSPRCKATVFEAGQGPLRCSLARLAWEICSQSW